MKDFKRDEGKIRPSLLLPGFIKEMAAAMTYGANKYEPWSWYKVDNAVERYKDALLRHFLSWSEGQEKDKESGLNHLAHLACCAMILWGLTKLLKYPFKTNFGK